MIIFIFCVHGCCVGWSVVLANSSSDDEFDVLSDEVSDDEGTDEFEDELTSEDNELMLPDLLLTLEVLS